MRVPAAVIELHESHTTLHQTPGQEARLAKRVAAIIVTQLVRLLVQIEGPLGCGRGNQAERLFIEGVASLNRARPVGLDRLLEDILDPSRNVDQAFRTTQIVSTDGRIISGLALREEGQVLVLADAQGKEVRVPKAEIETRATSQVSIMPSNVPDLVNDEQFALLVRYLLAQRVAAVEGK